jgi:8-oxo-dGTP diphosphatase
MTVDCEFEDGNRAQLRHATATGIVVKDNALLLTRRAAHLLEGNKLALPGGYMDLDETVIETVTREVLEETGYVATNPQLFRVITAPKRPNENNRQNVDFIFVLDSGDLVGEPDHESTEVFWEDLDSLRLEDLAFDQPETVRLYLEHRISPKVLPLLH